MDANLSSYLYLTTRLILYPRLKRLVLMLLRLCASLVGVDVEN
jgi:hypothetical protein